MIGQRPDPAAMRFEFQIVEVDHPDQWWTVTRSQLKVQPDPGLADDSSPHDRSGDIRWGLIGALLSQVSAKLDACDYAGSDELSDTVEVEISGHPGGYTLAEARVIESWFAHSSSPKADPWQLQTVSGPARIRDIWRHRPDAHLPMRSHLLDLLDHAQAGPLTATAQQQAAAGLAQLPAIVRERSPRYAALLEAAADAPVGGSANNEPSNPRQRSSAMSSWPRLNVYLYHDGHGRKAFPWPMKPWEALLYMAAAAVIGYGGLRLGWDLSMIIFTMPTPARIVVVLAVPLAGLGIFAKILAFFRPKDLAERFRALEQGDVNARPPAEGA